MSKKTTSTSRPSVLPILKTRGKVKRSPKGATNADDEQPTIPMETPVIDAPETPAATAVPEAPPAPPEVPAANVSLVLCRAASQVQAVVRPTPSVSVSLFPAES